MDTSRRDRYRVVLNESGKTYHKILNVRCIYLIEIFLKNVNFGYNTFSIWLTLFCLSDHGHNIVDKFDFVRTP